MNPTDDTPGPRDAALLRRIQKRIISRDFRIVVMGTGYVGLPTAAVFSDAGFQVTAVDKRIAIVESINSGRSPIVEPLLNELISKSVRSGNLRARQELGAIPEVDAILVAVQTPIRANTKPNLSFLQGALRDIAKSVARGAIVCVVSTLPPGTMMRTIRPLLNSLTGLESGVDFFLAYTPERMSPGSAVQEFKGSPRVVGGINRQSTEAAAMLFKEVCSTILPTDAPSAELSKLAENAYRDLNIAFANHLALISEHSHADVMEVIRLANTHPRIGIHRPGPGVGGPCLTKDPLMLDSDAVFGKPSVITEGRRINNYMAKHVVDMTLRGLKSSKKVVRQCSVAVLGAAYKGGVDDARESPSRIIVEGILPKVREVRIYDPFCSESFGATVAKNLKECVNGSDCVITATDHEMFKSLDLSELKRRMNANPIIVDARRLIDGSSARKLGFTYLGLGEGRD